MEQNRLGIVEVSEPSYILVTYQECMGYSMNNTS